MGRTPYLLVALLLLAFAAPAAAQEPPPLAATLAGCNSGPTAAERFALFTGSMPAIAGTQRMAMRFDLLERRITGTKGWRVIRAPRFGTWQRSKPGRSGFVYTKRVEGLRQGSLYQAVVKFRWYDADGRIQRETRRRTPACEQPDQRPDLLVEAFDVRRNADGTTTYVVTVANAGATAAGAFSLGLVSPSGEVARRVAGLPARERTTLEISGAACEAREKVQLTVDVRGQVAESDERNNVSVRLCPGTGT